MIIEGFKLMAIGMSIVMVFLCLMILCIQLITRLTRNVALEELAILEQERKAKAKSRARTSKSHSRSDLITPDSDSPPIAVFMAAIAAYEADRLRT